MISIRVIICIVFSMFITLKIAYGGIRVVNILRSPGAYNSCECNEALGSITVEASGTAGPFVVEFIANFVCADVVSEVAPDQEYEPFRNVNGQITVDGLCPGSYSFKVTDNFGCVTTLEADMQPCAEEDAIYPLIRSIQPIQNSTSNDGILEVSSGTGNSLSEAMIEWSGPNGFSSTEKRISGLSPGKYDVTVTSACGSQTASFDFTSCEEDPIDISADIRNTCPGFSAGRIELPRGTIAMWDDGASGFRRRDLSKGTYGFNATDRRGCKGQGSYSIQESIEVNNVWNRCTLTQTCFELSTEPTRFAEVKRNPRNGRCEYVGIFCDNPTMRFVGDELAKLTKDITANTTSCVRRIYNEEIPIPRLCSRTNGRYEGDFETNCDGPTNSYCNYVVTCNISGENPIEVVRENVTVVGDAICHPGTGCIYELYCVQESPFNSFCQVFVPSSNSADRRYLDSLASLHSTLDTPNRKKFNTKQNSVANKGASQLDIYPNPVNNVINVRHNNPISSLRILNLTGTQVWSDQLRLKLLENSIDVSFLYPGIYFLVVEFYDGEVEALKFVKTER